MRSHPITVQWRWPATDHKPHCRHVPINKIWRQTESTPRSGRRRSHTAGIYGDCSTREINNCFVLLARPGSPTDKLWDNCNRLYRGQCQNPTEQTNFSTAFGMFSYRRKVTENVLQSLSTQPILSFCQWLAHLIIYYTRLTALCPGLPGWAGTRNVKPISELQWHQLGHIQVCISLQTENHASTPPLSFLQAGCPFCRRTNSVKALKASLNHLII